MLSSFPSARNARVFRNLVFRSAFAVERRANDEAAEKYVKGKGITVLSENSQKLADAIIKLLQNENLRKQMGK